MLPDTTLHISHMKCTPSLGDRGVVQGLKHGKPQICPGFMTPQRDSSIITQGMVSQLNMLKVLPLCAITSTSSVGEGSGSSADDLVDDLRELRVDRLLLDLFDS